MTQHTLPERRDDIVIKGGFTAQLYQHKGERQITVYEAVHPGECIYDGPVAPLLEIAAALSPAHPVPAAPSDKATEAAWKVLKFGRHPDDVSLIAAALQPFLEAHPTPSVSKGLEEFLKTPEAVRAYEGERAFLVAAEVAREVIWTVGPKVIDDEPTVQKIAALVQAYAEKEVREEKKLLNNEVEVLSRHNISYLEEAGKLRKTIADLEQRGEELVEVLKSAAPFIGYCAHVPDIKTRVDEVLARHAQAKVKESANDNTPMRKAI